MTQPVKERNSTFKKNLQSARRLKSVTQKVASEKIGITPQSLSAYEEGRCEPPFIVLEKIINYYGIPKTRVSDFIYGEYPVILEKKTVSQEY